MKFTITCSIIAISLIIGAVVVTRNDNGGSGEGNNVSIVDGKQIIDLTARGGYSPRQSTAKAGIPTILKVKTGGTFDCSSAIRIPSMNISRNLPASGNTEIDLGSPQVSLLQGTCGMG